MVIYLSVEKVFLHEIPIVEKRFWHQHVALEIRNRDLYSSFFVNLLFKIPLKFEPNFWKMFKFSNESVWLLKCVSNSKLKYHLSVFRLLSSFSSNPQNTLWVIFDSRRLATGIYVQGLSLLIGVLTVCEAPSKNLYHRASKVVLVLS